VETKHCHETASVTMVKEFCTAISYGNNQTKYKEGHVNIDSKERIRYNNDTG